MDRRIRDQLNEEYRLQRERNAAEEQRRREEIRTSAPRVWTLITQRQDMIERFCRQALADGAFQPSEAALREANAAIRDALVQAGYPETYLEPVFRCEKCRDTGIMGDTVRQECDCWRRRAFELANTVGQRDESFERFDENVFPETVPKGRTITQREEMRRLRAYCEAYANRYPEQRPRDMLLYGASGLGKSYLLHCVARRLQERGFQAELISAYDVIRVMRDAYFGREDDTQRLYDADVLLIDDLGMEPMMENITIEQLFQLVNVRRSRELPMVFSTNLDTEEIRQRYTERLASRLFDRTLCQVIRVVGEDIRQKSHSALREQ